MRIKRELACFALNKCEPRMMKVMQVMSLSRIRVAKPEADPGTELIAVEEESSTVRLSWYKALVV